MAFPKKEKNYLIAASAAAKIIGVSGALLVYWRRKGMQLPFINKDGKIKYKLADVERVRDERNAHVQKKRNEVLVERAFADIEKSRKKITATKAKERSKLVTLDDLPPLPSYNTTPAGTHEECQGIIGRKDDSREIPQNLAKIAQPPKSWHILAVWIGFVIAILVTAKGFQYEARVTTLETKLEALQEIMQ